MLWWRIILWIWFLQFTSFRPKTSFLPIKTATVLALWYYVPLLTFVSCSFPHWSRRWRFAVDVTWLQWGTCDCRGTADIYSLLGMVWSWHAKHAQLKSSCLRQITLGQAFHKWILQSWHLTGACKINFYVVKFLGNFNVANWPNCEIKVLFINTQFTKYQKNHSSLWYQYNI